MSLGGGTNVVFMGTVSERAAKVFILSILHRDGRPDDTECTNKTKSSFIAG